MSIGTELTLGGCRYSRGGGGADADIAGGGQMQIIIAGGADADIAGGGRCRYSGGGGADADNYSRGGADADIAGGGGRYIRGPGADI